LKIFFQLRYKLFYLITNRAVPSIFPESVMVATTFVPGPSLNAPLASSFSPAVFRIYP